MTAKTLNRPLSEPERALAAQYHNLIWRVMRDLNMRPDGPGDPYGEAALGLMLAAQRYLQDEALQKYRFTTIAYRCIRRGLLNMRKCEYRRSQPLSLDAERADGGTLYDILPDRGAADPAALTGVYRFPAGPDETEAA